MQQPPVYNTLEDIRLRKEQLSQQIETQGNQISTMWNTMFERREGATRGQMVAGLVSNAITAIDAFLLVRKLVKGYGSFFNIFTQRRRRK